MMGAQNPLVVLACQRSKRALDLSALATKVNPSLVDINVRLVLLDAMRGRRHRRPW